MKIGGERVKGFVMKPLTDGSYYFGWEPSPAERAKGWKSLKIEETELGKAITAAKAQNAKVEEWKNGGAKPRAVATYTRPRTFGAMLDRYETQKMVSLAASTQRVDQTDLDRLRAWAGDQPIAWISRARVRALKLAFCPDADKVPRLMRDGVRYIPGHNVAFKLLSKGRDVFAWDLKHAEPMAKANPFEQFDLPKPPPRIEIWEPDCLDLYAEAANALGLPSIGFAVRLAANYGQREADILSTNRTHWREISLRQLRMDRETYAALKSDHGPDAGKVMGLYVKQGKTQRWVGVPIAGAMRDEIEGAIAAADARLRASASLSTGALIVRDRHSDAWRGPSSVGEPWTQRDFIEKVAEIRDACVAVAIMEGNMDLAERMSALEFRDLRRTCVVFLGELGMEAGAISARTGHSIKTVEQILEIYMPRTEAMAARGTVALLELERRDRHDGDKENVR